MLLINTIIIYFLIGFTSSADKQMCSEIPERLLGDILGAAFNARYMSIKTPPNEIEIKSVQSTSLKRAPSSLPSFYVDDDYSREIDDQPAWQTTHVRFDLTAHVRKRDTYHKQQHVKFIPHHLTSKTNVNNRDDFTNKQNIGTKITISEKENSDISRKTNRSEFLSEPIKLTSKTNQNGNNKTRIVPAVSITNESEDVIGKPDMSKTPDMNKTKDVSQVPFDVSASVTITPERTKRVLENVNKHRSGVDFIDDDVGIDLMDENVSSELYDDVSDKVSKRGALDDTNKFIDDRINVFLMNKRSVKTGRQWECLSRIRWLDLGPDYFPRYLRSVECTSENCWYDMLKCKPRSFTVKLLRRKRDRCVPLSNVKQGVVGLPVELRELWVWEERAVNFCCDCTFH